MLSTKKREAQQRYVATIVMLAEKFPSTFMVLEQRRRPLKIGIHHDIAAAVGADISAQALSEALRYYTRSIWYQRACIEGAERVDLDGRCAGRITAADAAAAQANADKLIAKRQAKAAAQRAPKQAPAPPPAPAPPRIGFSELRAAAARRKPSRRSNEASATTIPSSTAASEERPRGTASAWRGKRWRA